MEGSLLSLAHPEMSLSELEKLCITHMAAPIVQQTVDGRIDPNGQCSLLRLATHSRFYYDCIDVILEEIHVLIMNQDVVLSDCSEDQCQDPILREKVIFGLNNVLDNFGNVFTDSKAKAHMLDLAFHDCKDRDIDLYIYSDHMLENVNHPGHKYLTFSVDDKTRLEFRVNVTHSFEDKCSRWTSYINCLVYIPKTAKNEILERRHEQRKAIDFLTEDGFVIVCNKRTKS